MSQVSPKLQIILNLVVLFSKLENSSRTRLSIFLSDSETATFLYALRAPWLVVVNGSLFSCYLFRLCLLSGVPEGFLLLVLRIWWIVGVVV